MKTVSKFMDYLMAIDKVLDYRANDGSLCSECPHNIKSPDIDYYSCAVLENKANPEDAPCIIKE